MVPLGIRRSARLVITILSLILQASSSTQRIDHSFAFVFLVMCQRWLVCELCLLLFSQMLILPYQYISLLLQLTRIIVEFLKCRSLFSFLTHNVP